MNKLEKAKNKLFSTLKNIDESEDCCSIGQFHWRSNYGVFKDLPFHKGDSSYYFEDSKGLKVVDEDYRMSEEYEIPETATDWFDQSYIRNEELFVAHLTIFHKGFVKYIFEIVDGEMIKASKIKAINSFFKSGIFCYQINADDILSNNDLYMTKKLPVKELIIRYH